MDWLLDVSDFVRRGNAGPGWTSSLIYAYKFANLVISCSFFSIPFVLVVFWKKRRNSISRSWATLLFALFILLSGLHHFIDIVVFYWPAYRLFTVLSCLTAMVAFATACTLPPVVLSLIKLPSRESIHRINGELNKVVLEQSLQNDILEERNRKLTEHIKRLEDMLETNAWMHDKGTALKELREMLLTVESTKAKDY